ncbi:MAG: copper chaperone [Verrucomicrobia bacterium]|nr:MAG: copper chaperone [Verrucomicrobiota bacterium]
MKRNLKFLPIAAALVALPLTFHADDTKSACPASAASACDTKAGACCPADKAVRTTAAGVCPVSGKVAATTAKPRLIQATYQVEGMACSACESKVAKALGAIEGVKSPSACSKSKVAKVAFDPTKVEDRQLVAAIEKAGFKVKAETIQVSVEGMHCNACSAKVAKAVASLPGVQKEEVCHQSKKAVITFDPRKVDSRKILAAIESSGFKVAP